MKKHFARRANALESDDPVAGDGALAAIAHAFVIEAPPKAKLIEVAKQLEFLFR